MSNTFFVAPTKNFVQKTLNGAITNVAASITLNNTTNMQAPGYIVIDRTDSNGTVTPNAREVVYYTGIAGSQLTGCTRGADNDTTLSHGDGAIVEQTFTEGMWNSLVTIVSSALDGNGMLLPLVSPLTVSYAQLTQGVFTSVASIAEARLTREFVSTLTVTSQINVAGASVVGIGLYPTWVVAGGYSGATIALGLPLSTPRPATLQWASVMTRTVASAASVVFDFKKNGVSIFAGVTFPVIVGGGTFVSTASINVKNIDAGNVLTTDIKTIDIPGVITDLTFQLGGA